MDIKDITAAIESLEPGQTRHFQTTKANGDLLTCFRVMRSGVSEYMIVAGGVAKWRSCFGHAASSVAHFIRNRPGATFKRTTTYVPR